MSATISECGQYRYDLVRYMRDACTPCVFVMLNPSTADATQDDATIRRCKAYAQSWGYGKLVVVNLFVFRATKPEDLKRADDPIGWKGPIVCAWGVHGSHRGRHWEVLDMINDLGGQPMALKVTKDKHPSHPLYLRRDLKPILYTDRPRVYSNTIKVR